MLFRILFTFYTAIKMKHRLSIHILFFLLLRLLDSLGFYLSTTFINKWFQNKIFLVLIIDVQKLLITLASAPGWVGTTG